MSRESGNTGKRSRAVIRSPFFFLSVACIVLYWIAAIFYFVVDPYDVYPWGIRLRLMPVDYPRGMTRYMVDIVAKDPTIDTVLIGGSTSFDFTRDMMKTILGAENPFNVSYGGSRPRDRSAITGEFLKYSHAKRILLSFDFDYAYAEDSMQESFPIYLYDDNPLNDFRAANASGVHAAWQRLIADGVIGGAARPRTRSPTVRRAYGTQAGLNTLRRALEREASSIDTPSRRSCGDFATLQRQLIPFAQALSKKGVEFDMYIPPVSIFAYYVFAELPGLGDSALNDQLLMRRCLVEAIKDLPGVYLFGFDNEEWITSDLGNYLDTTHTDRPEIQAFILKAIAERTHLLTLQNIDDYDETLHRRVLAAKAPEHPAGRTP